MLIDGHYGLSSSFGPEHTVDGGDGDPAGNGPYVKASRNLAPHQGTVYSVVGSSSKNGAVSQHPVMNVWISFEGSLLVDVAGNQLDAYWIAKDGSVDDQFRIIKGPDRVPGLPAWWSAIAALAVAVAILAASRRVRGLRPQTPSAGAAAERSCS